MVGANIVTIVGKAKKKQQKRNINVVLKKPMMGK